MRVAIQTLGTRGDVQPYLALARGMMARGHDVQVAGPAQFEAFSAENGVPFAALPGEFLKLMDTPEGKAAIAGGKGFSAGFKILKHVRPLMTRLLDEEWTAVRAYQPDLIIHHPKSFISPHMAEALATPHIQASPLPGFTPTAAFPSPILPFASLGPLNRASHALAINGAQILFRKELSAWRLKNSLYPRKKPPPASGTLYAYSPSVLAAPHDWGKDVLVSGYWFLDSPEWVPDAALASFLAAGDKPVYVGFGSMPGLDPATLTATIVEALSRTGQRGLLASGWGAVTGTALPSNVHMIQAAPHDRLFPLVSATVHHGGAGTTGASLRAGIPTTIMPFFGDQPFWARQVVDLGVGPRPLHRKTLTVDSLATALQAMTLPDMRKKAAAIGGAIQQESGVAATVQFIEDRVKPSAAI